MSNYYPPGYSSQDEWLRQCLGEQRIAERVVELIEKAAPAATTTAAATSPAQASPAPLRGTEPMKPDMHTIRKSLAAKAGEGGPEGRAALRALQKLSGDAPRGVRPAARSTTAETRTPSAAKLEAQVAKLEAESPVGKLLASRPDLSDAVRAQLRACPADVVASYLRTHPSPRLDLAVRMGVASSTDTEVSFDGAAHRFPAASHTKAAR